MALRAVIFDYGMVLSAPPEPAAHAELLRITGLPAVQLDALYWADRSAFDAGQLTGEAYWHGLLRKAELNLSPAAVAELIVWDARMWMTANAPMLAWAQALKATGILTAILSNIGDTVEQAMVRELDWLQGFDVCVWSHRLRLAKPDAAIYCHVLQQLGVEPHEALFIDDRQVNVEAALALGINALVFTTVAELRAGLIAMGLEKLLPLPAVA